MYTPLKSHSNANLNLKLINQGVCFLFVQPYQIMKNAQMSAFTTKVLLIIINFCRSKTGFKIQAMKCVETK